MVLNCSNKHSGNTSEILSAKDIIKQTEYTKPKGFKKRLDKQLLRNNVGVVHVFYLYICIFYFNTCIYTQKTSDL